MSNERIIFLAPWLILILSFLTSISTVLACGIGLNTTSSGRGGAIAVAISLLYLFFDRSRGSKSLRQVNKDLEEAKSRFLTAPSSLQNQIERIRSKLEMLIESIISSAQKDQRDKLYNNILLALSTLIGTLFWGFGDVAAEALYHSTELETRRLAASNLDNSQKLNETRQKIENLSLEIKILQKQLRTGQTVCQRP